MTEAIRQHTLANGLTLLAERMPHVRSATLYFLVPAGCAHDPVDRSGLASVLAEMAIRGAGERDSESLSLALDNLGVDRGESVGLLNMWFYGGTLARNLPATLAIYADILRRPHLPPEDFEAARDLVLADLQALEDSPQEQVLIELRKRFYPEPLNRDRCGDIAGLNAITMDDIRKQQARAFRPNGTILSVAGNVDWEMLVDLVEKLFGDWPPGTEQPLNIARTHGRSEHLFKGTQQTQIALAFPSVTMTHPMYFAARGAVSVLSGGMSARLFTEVREKRGLCYSVFAIHETLCDRAAVLAYSGTRTDRAQETLDVMLAEMKKLSVSISTEELARVQAGLKTALILQQESTSARAGAIARDWYFLNRVRSFDELQAAVDGLTVQAMLDYAREYPLTRPTVVTLGPTPLTLPE